MRIVHAVLVTSALLITACTSGSDPVAEPVVNEGAPVDTDTPDDTATSVDTTPTASETTTIPGGSTGGSTTIVPDGSTTTVPDGSTATVPDGADEASGGDPLVIDGPARVRTSCDSLPQGVTDFSVDAGGGTHEVRIYVPAAVSSDPAPVVLNWHGLGSNGPQQAALSGYETLAEQEGFIVVHPTALRIVDGGATIWELAQFDLPGRDDLAFADTLIDTVVDDWCADPTRVYSTGMSNGGFFTAELICNRSDRIAAAVSVAGLSHAETCDPDRAVPYVAYHGTADDVVPFDGGDSLLSDIPNVGGFGDAGFFDQVMPDEFAEFAAEAGCDAEPARVEETPEVVRRDFSGCDDGVSMTFYEIVGGGHTWPSSPLSDELADLGTFTQDVDATADGWAFMSQYSL